MYLRKFSEPRHRAGPSLVCGQQRTREDTGHRVLIEAARTVRRHDLDHLSAEPERDELGHAQQTRRRAERVSEIDRNQFAPVDWEHERRPQTD